MPATSLRQVLAAVADQHGEQMTRLIESGMVLVDGERVPLGEDQMLGASAVVEILPPFAGG